jgi:hypothetical protein
MIKIFVTLLLLSSTVISRAEDKLALNFITPVDQVFIPAGFDSNDRMEIVVSGYLPDMCYDKPKAQVFIENKMIIVYMTAERTQEAASNWCPQVLIPFVETVSISTLVSGHYDLLVNPNTPYSHQREFFVEEASSTSIDDFTYANVESIEFDEQEGILTLKGNHPSQCQTIDPVEFRFISNKKDTYAVLPVIKSTSERCPLKLSPYVYKVTVPTDITGEKILLHVRSMRGKSLNLVVRNGLKARMSAEE